KSPYYDKKLLVELSGEVLYPGKYVITRKDERISDIIARAGGLTEYAFSDGARLVRRTEYFEEGSGQGNVSKVRRQELEAILKRDTIELADSRAFPKEETIGIDLVQIMKNPKSEFDLILKEGDLLNVPRELQTVRVRGEVLYPSNVRFSENFGFKDFISQAGGYSSQASKRRAYVLYPNGTAERTKSFLWFKKYPQVTPGTEIILPGKPDRRGLSPQELVGLSTGLASLALILTNIF
ncbi:MAG: SLBB domain-containing protein, partial [Marinoscillum sp.]